jgi:hypothetical protein
LASRSPPVLIDDSDALERAILAYVGPLLASGKIRAAGIDNRGELVWIPSSTWRVRIRAHNCTGSNFEQALCGMQIFVRGMTGGERRCIPLLTEADFYSIMGITDTPTPMSVKPLDITSPPVSPKPPPIAEQPRRNPGGRQAKHDWDAFWIEVARYAVKHHMEEKHRPELQKHMEQWTGKISLDPPDEATIRKKLSDLFTRATARN